MCNVAEWLGVSQSYTPFTDTPKLTASLHIVKTYHRIGLSHTVFQQGPFLLAVVSGETAQKGTAEQQQQGLLCNIEFDCRSGTLQCSAAQTSKPCKQHAGLDTDTACASYSTAICRAACLHKCWF